MPVDEQISEITKKLNEGEEQITEGLRMLNDLYLFNHEDLLAGKPLEPISNRLLELLNKPPNDQILGLCATCIRSSLNISKFSHLLHKQVDFQLIDRYIRKKDVRFQISDETTKNLLELLFNISNTLALDIATNIEIDTFFKYFDKFAIPEKINCLKAINKILETKVLMRHNRFLEDLIQTTFDANPQISSGSAKALLRIFEQNKQITDVSNELKFINNVCNYTAKCDDRVYLIGFLNMICSCIKLPKQLKVVLSNNELDYTNFFHKYFYDLEVIKSLINLIMVFASKPSGEAVQDSTWSSVLGDEFLVGKVASIRDGILPFIYRLYITQATMSSQCMQLIAAFCERSELDLPDSVVIMLSIHAKSAENNPLISAIISKMINRQRACQSGIVSRLNNKIELINGNYRKNHEIQNEFLLENDEKNSNVCKSIVEFVEKIQSGELNSFICLNCFKDIRFTDLNNEDTNVPIQLDALEKLIEASISNKEEMKYQPQYIVLINFLLNMLLNMPFPFQVSDPYVLKSYKELYETQISLNESNTKFCHSLLEDEFQKNVSSMQSNITNIITLLKKSEISDYIDFEPFGDFKNMSDTIKAVIFREINAPSYKRYKYTLDDVQVNTDTFLLNAISQVTQNSPKLTTNVTVKTELYEKQQSKEKTFPRPKEFTADTSVKAVLEILKLLFDANKSNTSFYNKQFIDNMTEQMKSLYFTLSCSSPCSQLMCNYPFLFPFKERLFFFRTFIYEPDLLIEEYSQRFIKDYEKNKALVPMHKIKVFVDRENLFKNGLTILRHFGKYNIFIEFQFKGEVGHGAGPAREFFTLMSHEFCRRRHKIWQNDCTYKKYAHKNKGLFPRATAKDQYMYDLGLFCAKALQMRMVIDIPFNPAFFDLVCDREIKMESVDDEIANSIKSLNDQNIDGLEFYFTFTCGSNGEKDIIEMVKNGKNIKVTAKNLDKYKQKVEEFVCGRYIEPKAKKFKEGFSEVIDAELLKLFTGEEIARILNGDKCCLSKEDLQTYVKLEKSIQSDEKIINDFYDIVSSMESKEQLMLIQFITGSSNLPIGGIQSLDPHISIAKANPEEGQNADERLPSASVCKYYLKLPPYSTKEIMKEKIMIAIREGNEGFQFN